MINNDMPIGIIDSGVGGLTVVRELHKLLPTEDLIYFGDNINCPYGNKNAYEIKSLTSRMLDFMEMKKVKVLVVACNTITTILEMLTHKYDFNIIGIIQPVVEHVEKLGVKKIGLVATGVTVNSKYYEKTFKNNKVDIEVISEGSQSLALLIEKGILENRDIEEEVSRLIFEIDQKDHIDYIILGCTHFPIVEDIFEKKFPSKKYINPALEQALNVQQYLSNNGLLANKGKGLLTIYTSGFPYIYEEIIEKLGINVSSITRISLDEKA